MLYELAWVYVRLGDFDGEQDGDANAGQRTEQAIERFEEVLLERRREEDLLSQALYSALPAPESQLVALAHSLVARGVIDEEALARRMEAVRARLEAAGSPVESIDRSQQTRSR